MGSLLVDYTAAGFDPSEFWRLTPRLFDLHMRGAMIRIEREIEISNRQAYNTAALSGGAICGKLESYDRIFRPRQRIGKPQSAELLEAQLKILAVAWGAGAA